jgi:hypothetical protein
MSKDTAQRWVVISALIVAGIYAYRRLTEATSSPVTLKKLVGIGNPVPLGAFATAWGFTYLVVAIMAEASPGLGGSFAILIATTDILTNASEVLADITKQETPASTAAAATTATGRTQVAAGVNNPNLSQGGAQIVGGTVTQGVGKIGSSTVGF